MSESQDLCVSNSKILSDSKSSEICLEKDSDFKDSNASNATFDFETALKNSPEKITKYLDEIGVNMDEFICNSEIESGVNDSKSNVTESEKKIELDFCEDGGSDYLISIYEDAKTQLKEEFFDANQFFNDPSSLDYLEHAGSSKAPSESSMARSSLYQKFDPLHAKFFPEFNIQSKELRESVNENAPELNNLENNLASDDLDRKVKTDKPQNIINDALIDEAEVNLESNIFRDMHVDDSQSDTINMNLSNTSLEQSLKNVLFSLESLKKLISFDSEVMSESQNALVSNAKYLVYSESPKICLEKFSDLAEISKASDTTFDFTKAPKTSLEKLTKYFDETGNNRDEFISNSEIESGINVSKSDISQSEKIIELNLCKHSGSDNSNVTHEDLATESKEEYFDANQFFNDPSFLDYLEHAGSSKAPSESSMARSSLYQKFDPLHAKFFPEFNIQSEELRASVNENAPELNNLENALASDDLDRKAETDKPQKIINDALIDESEVNLESNITHDMHVEDSQSDTINMNLSNTSLEQSLKNVLFSFESPKELISFDSEVMSESQNSLVSNAKYLVYSESPKICLEKFSDLTEISKASDTTFNFKKAPKTSLEKLTKYFDETGNNRDEFISNSKIESGINVSKSDISQSEKIIEPDLCKHSGSEN